MADYYLPSSSYRRPSAQLRSQTDSILTTKVEVPLILAHVEVSQTSEYGPAATWSYGAANDAHPASAPLPHAPAMATSPSTSSMYSDSSAAAAAEDYKPWRRSRNDVAFDQLYDVSDSESEEVPLQYSGSITESVIGISSSGRRSGTAAGRRNRYPSITIPSPSAWPTVEKLQKSTAATTSPAPTPLSCLPTPSAALAKLATRNLSLQVPTKSATPSLDGSMTSDELADLSCPSTPDSDEKIHKPGDWDAPLQLHPAALETLNQISNTGCESTDATEQVVEVPPQTQEMQEVPGSGGLDACIDIVVTPVDDAAVVQEDDFDVPSALSVPSPGGFFSSLRRSTRKTWSPSLEGDYPSTSVAENFYGLPWASDAEHQDDRSINTSAVSSRQDTHDSMTLVDENEVAEIEASAEDHKEKYEQDLQSIAAINLDRTNLWLSSQMSYEADAADSDNASTLIGSPRSKHQQKPSIGSSIGSPSKKSVRFADRPESPVQKEGKKSSSPSDSTFYRSFQNMQKGCAANDAFVHQHVRSETINMERLCFPASHRDQLHGRHELVEHLRPTAPRPVSNFYQKAKNVAAESSQAERERQASEQIKQSSWNLQAIKMLNGGKLLTNPVASNNSKKIRVLDLGGQSTCDWAWQVALDYPQATVYTVTDQLATSKLRGPRNHRVASVPNLWTLPFPDGSFDVISARTLHTLLKVDRATKESGDDYDRCLRECHRCLRVGGYLEFTVLDSDIVNAAGNHALAVSVEFGFNLKTRGYNPAPTRSFLPKLKASGFEDVNRAWIVLPFARTAGAMLADNVTRLSASSSTSSLSSSTTITPSGSDNVDVPEKIINPETGNVAVANTSAVHAAAAAQPSPMGSTSAISDLTGMVGAWNWESWMLKLHAEMGKDEERLLENIGAALEEGGNAGSGWRCLTGWARK